MSAQEMNSREWWDAYFRKEWDEHDGRDQTRGFMRTLLLNLPDDVLAYLLTNRLSALDWGCAKGDGVDVLSTAFPLLTAAGLDFSPQAIASAKAEYPEYTFIQTDDGAIPERYDVICTSNCLEHFAKPLDVAAAHLEHCNRLYLALVPYNEHPLFEQHAAQFREESFPEQFGDFVRLISQPIDVPAVYWPDQQLLAVYVHQAVLSDVVNAAQHCDPADVVRLRERLLVTEEHALYPEISRLHRQVNQMWHQEVGPRDALIAELRQNQSQTEAQRDALIADLRQELARAEARLQRLDTWRKRAQRFRAQLAQERERVSNLTTERDAYWSQLQFISGTKAWRLTQTYWRLRARGLVGWALLVAIVCGCILFSPLIIAALILRAVYKVVVPYRLRIRVYTWRKRVFARQHVRASLMNLYAYAFVRYKKKREALCPGGVEALRTPTITGLVSVILPVYNGADMLRESLASVLSQTYQNFELIAINDGSTDGSGEILEEYARQHGCMRVVHQENRKLPRTLSRGARLAQGEYLTWTSCDNRMKPDFLEQLVASLERHPDWDMVYANIDIIGEQGEPLRNSEWYEGYQQPPHSEHVHLPADVADLNVYPNNYVGAAFMYRSRAAWLLGDYSSIRFTTEDYDYWMRMNSLLTLRHADFDAPVYEYRFHKSSLTARDKELGITASRSRLMAFEDFRRDFQLAPMIWVIEGDTADAAARSVMSRLTRLARDRGHLLMSSAQIAAHALPQAWAPIVYVRVAETPSATLQPSVSLPTNAVRVLVVAHDPAGDGSQDPAAPWDMCVVVTKSAKLRRLNDGNDGQVGWFGCADVPTLFTAIDIRVRSHHELVIEQLIARTQSTAASCKVSVVVCAYKRTERVLQAVRSLAHQTLPQAEYEVIVVNNDADDTTLAGQLDEARRELFPEHPASLRYVENPVKGLSHARNAGIAEACGEVVSFLDDDAIAPTSWIEQTWKAFETHPEIGVVGGQIRLKAIVPAPDALQPGLETYWSEYRTNQQTLSAVDEWWAFPWGANWSARRLALLQVGGFRTRYGRMGASYSGGEEIVAAALIQAIGYTIAVAPDSEVLHDVEPHRFTWRHVEQTVIAGTLSHYLMELDLYIPVTLSLRSTLEETRRPHLAPELSAGRVGRRLRSYKRRALIRLAREQWNHRRARRTPGLVALETIRRSGK